MFLRGLPARLGMCLALNACAMSSAFAGSSFSSAPITGPVGLAAHGAWVSPCVAVIPPFDVFAATVGAASLSVQRFADKLCTYPIGVDLPLPVHTLTQAPACLAHSFCGDQGTPDLTPLQSLRINVTDTSAAQNTILAVVLLQDPPAGYVGDQAMPQQAPGAPVQ